MSVGLTKYLPKIKVRKEKNLLGGSTDGATEEVEEVEEVSAMNTLDYSRY